MRKTFDQSKIYPICLICGKGAVLGANKPHSQKRTNRAIKANIQSFYGLDVCTRCRRSSLHARRDSKDKL